MTFSMFLLRFFHIVAAAAWMAIPLAMVSTLKLGARHGQRSFEEAVRMSDRRGLMATVAGVVTLGTGLGMVFYLGGFKNVPKTIHGALGLVVVMLVLGFALMKPALGKLLPLAQGGRHEGPEAQALVRRLTIGSGILQLLWTVVLVLMVWR